MKKTYINPTMEVVKIQMTQMLAASQLDIDTANTQGVVEKSSDILGREYDFDDEDEY